MIPLFRTVMRKFVYQPGDGPTKEQTRKDRVEYRGVARPDTKEGTPRAFCRAYYDGSLYGRTLSFFLFDLKTRLTRSSYRRLSCRSSHLYPTRWT